MKFNKNGFGHKLSDKITDNWWSSVYNNAAKNIIVNDNQKLQVKDTDVKKVKKRSFYGGFVQKGVLENGREIVSDNSDSDEESGEKSVKVIVDDDALFAACGGRTAHKAARHGHKLNGKLARLEQQEKSMSKQNSGFIKKKNKGEKLSKSRLKNDAKSD